MLETYDEHWNGVMPGWYRMNKNFGPDFFLKRTHCPSIIIEPEFIHHKDLIVDNREKVCTAIAQALINYVSELDYA